MTAVQIYTAEQAAELLGCSVKTVEEWARTGLLPGIKPGGSWVFPAGALARRLDEVALEQAAQRRKPEDKPQPTAVGMKPGERPRRGRQSRALPTLVPVGGPTC